MGLVDGESEMTVWFDQSGGIFDSLPHGTCVVEDAPAMDDIVGGGELGFFGKQCGEGWVEDRGNADCGWMCEWLGKMGASLCKCHGAFRVEVATESACAELGCQTE